MNKIHNVSWDCFDTWNKVSRTPGLASDGDSTLRHAFFQSISHCEIYWQASWCTHYAFKVFGRMVPLAGNGYPAHMVRTWSLYLYLCSERWTNFCMRRVAKIQKLSRSFFEDFLPEKGLSGSATGNDSTKNLESVVSWISYQKSGTESLCLFSFVREKSHVDLKKYCFWDGSLGLCGVWQELNVTTINSEN